MRRQKPEADTLQASVSVLAHLRKDDYGLVHLGIDGVLRSLNADHTAVIDYLRLSPAQLAQILAASGHADAAAGVDGRDVTSEAQLMAVPVIEIREQAEVTSAKRDANIFRRDRCTVHGCQGTYNCQVISCSTCLSNTGFGSRNMCLA